MKTSLSKSSSYMAGEGHQIEILKNGLTPQAIVLLKNIILNHPNDVLKSFFAGLMGVSERD